MEQEVGPNQKDGRRSRPTRGAPAGQPAGLPAICWDLGPALFISHASCQTPRALIEPGQGRPASRRGLPSRPLIWRALGRGLILLVASFPSSPSPAASACACACARAPRRRRRRRRINNETPANRDPLESGPICIESPVGRALADRSSPGGLAQSNKDTPETWHGLVPLPGGRAFGTPGQRSGARHRCR